MASFGTRFRSIAESLADRFHFACRFQFRFCLPAGFRICLSAGFRITYRPLSGFACRLVSGLLTSRFLDLLTGRFPVFGNLATIIHQEKVAKVLLAQMKNEGDQGAYIVRALGFLSMWDEL